MSLAGWFRRYRGPMLCPTCGTLAAKGRHTWQDCEEALKRWASTKAMLDALKEEDVAP